MLGFGVFFYRLAEADGRPGFLWGGTSVLLYLCGLYFLDVSFWGLLGTQFLLFGVMWTLNIVKNRNA